MRLNPACAQSDCPLLWGIPLSFYYPSRDTYVSRRCNAVNIFTSRQNSSKLELTLYYSANSEDINYLVREMLGRAPAQGPGLPLNLQWCQPPAAMQQKQGRRASRLRSS